VRQSIKNKDIVVWFSCGAASAVAARLTLDLYGNDNRVRIVNNPVVEEDADNQRFLKDVEQWLSHPIESAQNPSFPDCSCVTVWDKRKFMSGPLGAPCTIELKKNARKHWEETNHHDYLVLGFTFDEQKRAERFRRGERDNLLAVLVDHGYTKSRCFIELQRAGLELPRIYRLGYPNANCIGCVKATSPSYWNHVREQHPEVFAERARQSRKIGAKLVRVNNKRIFLDELDPKAKGRALKTTAIECGIFCEESV